MDTEMAERGRRFEALVRDAMRRQGIDGISELARRTDTDRNSWYVWFGGSEPRRSTVRKAENALGLTVDQLMEPWDGGPKTITMNEDDLRSAIRDEIAEGVALALERLGLSPDARTRDE